MSQQKPKYEIYKLKYAKWTNEQGVPQWTMYVVGYKGFVDGEWVQPTEIKVMFDKVYVTYKTFDGDKESGIGVHEIPRDAGMEIFRRPLKQENGESEKTDNKG